MQFPSPTKSYIHDFFYRNMEYTRILHITNGVSNTFIMYYCTFIKGIIINE